MGNKEGTLLDPEHLKDRIPRSTLMELEDDWRKVVGGRKNQADFEQFQKLLPEKLNERDLEALLALYDHNKNGKIAWAEYLCTVTLLMDGSFEEKVGLIFHAFDQNGDNSVSKEELRDAIRKFSKPGEQVQHFVERVMTACDKDGNGSIDQSEFLRFVREDPEEYARVAGRLNITLS
jgi:Ca2+-binding EF-hand superfamily protein